MTWPRTTGYAPRIDPSSDFRFTQGKNNGLGNVNVYAKSATKTEYEYPWWNKFSDEGGKAIKGDLIYYIEPERLQPLSKTGLLQKQPRD